MRFAASQSLVCARPVGLLVPHTAVSRCFHRKGGLRAPSPVDLRLRVHPLTSFGRLYRVLLFDPPLALYELQGAFLGVTATLIATSAASVLTVTSQGHGLAALGVSHAFDGLLRWRPCGLVSSHYRVQGFSLQGFVPHAQQRSLVDSSMPSCRWRRLPAGSCPPAPARVAPPSGPCSVHESVASTMGFSHRPGSIPSWVFTSSRFSRSVPLGCFFTSLTAHGVAEEVSLSFLPLAFSVSTGPELGLPLPRLPTCSRFLAFRTG